MPNQSKIILGERILEKSDLVDFVSEAVIVTDLKGEIRFWNPFAEQLYGWRSDEVIGKNAAEVSISQLTKEQAEAIKKTLQQGLTWSGEVPSRKKSGMTFLAHLVATPIRDGSGHLLGTIEMAVATDTLSNIDEKIDTARNLVHALAQQEAILFSIGDALAVTDYDGRVTIVNRQFEQLLGWTKAEVEGKMLADLMSQEAKSTIVDFDHTVIASVLAGNTFKNDVQKPYWLVRRDGTRIPVVVTVNPIQRGNVVIGAVELIRDITEELELDQSKNDFMSLASHQLRTPLSTINWYLEMLISGDAGKLTEEQATYLKEAYEANQRMVELVNALLNVTRIESGTLFTKSEPVDLMAVVKTIIKEMALKIAGKELTLEEHYDKKLQPIMADSKIIAIIYQNLISNAVKYSLPKGKIRIELTQEEEDVLLAVSDSGLGIPKDEQEMIFTKLFRAGNARENVPEGSGLGLFMPKSILDKLGGQIRFESEQDKGTTFYVSLPKKGMREQTGSKTLVFGRLI